MTTPAPAARGGSWVQTALVTGPPGSGKSTYVARRVVPGDLVLDYDALYAAISALPYRAGAGSDPLHWFTLHAWRALLAKLEHDPDRLTRAWVVASLPEGHRREALGRRLDATVLLLGADEATCRARIAADATRDDAAKARATEWLTQWFVRYTPAASDRPVA